MLRFLTLCLVAHGILAKGQHLESHEILDDKNTALAFDPLASNAAILSSAAAFSEVPAPPNVTFHFWLLAFFWPATVVSPTAQSRARHLVIRHEARAGFWTHGLWPVRWD
jgi:ribonuclease I